MESLLRAHAVPHSQQRVEYHRQSRSADNLDIFEQPWCKLGWSGFRCHRFLVPAPEGAFLVRLSRQPGEMILDVQTGTRVGHLAIKLQTSERGLVFNLHPTAHWFESLFDLIIFYSQEPFVRRSEGSDDDCVCLSLPAVIKAKEIHAQLRHANAVARSIPGTHVLVQSAAPPGQPVDEDEEDEKQADMGMFGNSGPDAKSKATSPMLFCGFITKQGWIRKSWKRRFFVLHANACLIYYDVTRNVKRLAALNLRQCRGIVPGWRCKVDWLPQSDPALRFGVNMADREYYFAVETAAELQGWLQSLGEVLVRGVPVTTPAQIATLGMSEKPPAPPAPPTVKLHVCKNGFQSPRRTVVVPLESWPMILAHLSQAAAQPAARVFDGEGRELNDPTDLVANSTVYVSAGEDFTTPLAYSLPTPPVEVIYETIDDKEQIASTQPPELPPKPLKAMMGSANNRAEAESDSENDDAEASSKPKPVYATVQTKAHQQRDMDKEVVGVYDDLTGRDQLEDQTGHYDAPAENNARRALEDTTGHYDIWPPEEATGVYSQLPAEDEPTYATPLECRSSISADALPPMPDFIRHDTYMSVRALAKRSAEEDSSDSGSDFVDIEDVAMRDATLDTQHEDPAYLTAAELGSMRAHKR